MKQLFVAAFLFVLTALPASAQPNVFAQVESFAAGEYASEFACAHSHQPCAADFVILVARELGENWGVNGKRGNPNDISLDILAYRGQGNAVDVVNGGAMSIIDICGGCGAPGQRVTWNVGPGGPGDRGAWVDPFSVRTSTESGIPPRPTPTPQPQPTPTPTPSPSVNLQPVLDKLAELSARLDALKGEVAALKSEQGKTSEAVVELTGDLLDREFVITSIERFKADLQRIESAAVDGKNLAEQTRNRLEDVVKSSDFLASQFANPPSYRGSLFGATVTLRPVK